MSTAIAISDIGTMLYAKIAPATKYSEFLEVISAPATGSAPSPLEVTPLKYADKKYIQGRQDLSTVEFNYNYTEDNHETALGVCNGTIYSFLLIFQDGSGYRFDGMCDAFTNEIGRDSAIEATFVITVSDREWLTKAEVDALVATGSI